MTNSFKTFLLCTTIAGALSISNLHAADIHIVPDSESLIINEHSVCRNISNNNSSDIFIPTKTANEWNTGGSSFLENLPSNVTAASCVTGPLDCAQITSLGTLNTPSMTANGHTYATGISLNNESQYSEEYDRFFHVFNTGSNLILAAIVPPTSSTDAQHEATVTLPNAHVPTEFDVSIKANVVGDKYISVYYRSTAQTQRILSIYSYNGSSFSLEGTLSAPWPATSFETLARINNHYIIHYVSTSGSTTTRTLRAYEASGGTLTLKESVTLSNNITAFPVKKEESIHVTTTTPFTTTIKTFNGSTFQDIASYTPPSGNAIAYLGHIENNDYIVAYGTNPFFNANTAQRIRRSGTSFTNIGSPFQVGSNSTGILVSGARHITSDDYFFTNNGASDVASVQMQMFRYDGNNNKIVGANVNGVGSLSIGKKTPNLHILDGIGYFRIEEDNVCGGTECSLPDGGTIAHGQSIYAFSDDYPPQLADGGTCGPSELRTCNNGTLSGSLTHRVCVPTPPPIKVICTHYNAKGMLSDELYATEVAYANIIDPEIMRGYHWWGIPFVGVLKKTDFFDPLMVPMVNAWATEVSHRMGKHQKGSALGKVLLGIGEPLCKFIAAITKKETHKKRMNSYRYMASI